MTNDPSHPIEAKSFNKLDAVRSAAKEAALEAIPTTSVSNVAAIAPLAPRWAAYDESLGR